HPKEGEGGRTWTNQEVGALLNRIGDILDLQGEISFKVNAYRRAADTIDHMSRALQDIWQGEAKNLREVPGIGEALSEKLDELFRSGQMSYYEKISRDIPPGVLDFLTIPGVGPKTAARFWKELEVTDVPQLEAALAAGKLAGMKGFSDKSQQKVLEGIAATRRKGTRRTLATVFPFASEVTEALTKATGRAIEQISVGGSLRRLKATIGDLDFLAASSDPDRVLDAFCKLPFVAQVLAKGGTKASVVAHNGLQMDLRVLEPARWGTALQYFTGSKEHNVTIRQLALEQGWSLNEWALTNVKTGKEVLCATEEEVYERLGLEWIPPELRENFGEVEAARKDKLPKLIGWKDLRGDLQCHSTWSDGRYSIHDMAEAARARGLHYMGLTDHSKSLGVTRGLDEKRLVEQWKEIDELNKTWKDFRVLKSTEVEIRADGTLDYDDEWLAKFDLVIASTHSALTQPREKITARVERALRNPYVDVFAHPTGRLLGQREASALDMEVVFRVAKETGTILEVDGTSDRMDLDDTHVRRALELGLKIVVDSDAHAPAGFDDLFWGLAMARRGWATKADVLNTLEWAELKKHLKRNKS
ncbi:MAG TPA: DNA polymerase/3'-5' exonuclease PolX, partial [Anaerolineae bacterium]